MFHNWYANHLSWYMFLVLLMIEFSIYMCSCTQWIIQCLLYCDIMWNLWMFLLGKVSANEWLSMQYMNRPGLLSGSLLWLRVRKGLSYWGGPNIIYILQSLTSPLNLAESGAIKLSGCVNVLDVAVNGKDIILICNCESDELWSMLTLRHCL